MSGSILGPGNDDLFQRYQQRLIELSQRNPNRSLASSTIGSLSESVASSSKGRNANGTLSSHQFYHRNSNPQQFQSENNSSIQIHGSSTSTGVASDASVFKKPLPVKLYCRSHFDRKIDLLADSLRTVEDKQTRKYMVTVIETLLHACKNPPFPPPVNPLNIMDYISTLVKDEYYSKQIPKSICGSSVVSDQASDIGQYACNSERSIRLDKRAPDSRSALQDITQSSVCRAPPRDTRNQEYTSHGGLSSFQHQETSVVREAVNKRGRTNQSHLETLFERPFNILDDSVMARMRDEAAAAQEVSGRAVPARQNSKTLPKATPKPSVNSGKGSRAKKAEATKSNGSSKVSVPASRNCSMDQSKSNVSLLNGHGVSRSGRTLKAPVKYWNSKGETSNEEVDESIFNKSMTLRNKKTVEKKTTPPLRASRKNTPTLPAIAESTPAITNARGRPAKASKGKENNSGTKKKSVKKQTETPAVKNTTSKGKPNKKEATKQSSEKTAKKPAPKRKSGESDDLMSKRQKIEDPEESDADEEDIFGVPSYKKSTFQNPKVALVAVSPTTALLSAKKAAGEAQGRATPPCKAIGDMMMNESFRSTMSAPREAPKQNEAVKRVTKKMEKSRMKPGQSKTQVKKTSKEVPLNELMEAVKSSFSVNNNMCSGTLTVLRGTEAESESSDMEEYDDDEDLQ